MLQARARSFFQLHPLVNCRRSERERYYLRVSRSLLSPRALERFHFRSLKVCVGGEG